MKGLKSKKSIILCSILFISSVFGLNVAYGTQKPNDFIPGLLNLETQPWMLDTVESTGTRFEVISNGYLDITLTSDEPVHLTLESIPRMVMMRIAATKQTTSTKITLCGSSPLTTYYKYEDNYHNIAIFTTDSNGRYSYTQDLTKPHLIFIQPRPSTKFIPGDTSIGVWDPVTRTYTLSTNVNETIQIEEDNLTLNGAGYSIIGAGSGCGIYLHERTGVTVRNLNVEGFSYGIHLYNSNVNTLTNNTAAWNSRYAIYLLNSNGNTVTDNTASNSHEGIFLRHSSDNTLTSNITSNHYSGIYLHNDSNNNTLTNNIASKNSLGIYLCNSSENNLINNTANSNDYYGIFLHNNHNNVLTENTASWNHSHGIYLYNSNDNILTANTVSRNFSGIYLYYNCNNNFLTINTISNNYYGIYFYYSCNNNEVYNNNFINNQTQAYVHSSSGNVFNRLAPIGGNFWSDWTTSNTDGDAFIDNPYVFISGQDNLPWVRQNAWFNQPPTADAGPDQEAHPRDMVTLDGSGSSDPESDYPLVYSWQIVSKPQGSTAELSDAITVNPSFTVDMLGDYTIELVVTDSLGAPSTADEVLISTFNTVPTAIAGLDQTIIQIGTTVELDGTQSFDPDGDEITYSWTIEQKPAGSSAELSNPNSPMPTFIADIHSESDYVIALIVSDEFGAISEPDSVIISFENIKPVADAGQDQSVTQGDTVVLDGGASIDDNGDALSYSWSFASRPEGSMAELIGPTSVQTSFVADKSGVYVVSLVVNDGFVDSNTPNVTITAISHHEEAVRLLLEAIDIVADLDPAILKDGNVTSDSLINKINAVLKMINKGNYVTALGKLENDILEHMDGCADSGEPDSDDWIMTCEGQSQVYPLVVEAMEHLQNLI